MRTRNDVLYIESKFNLLGRLFDFGWRRQEQVRHVVRGRRRRIVKVDVGEDDLNAFATVTAELVFALDVTAMWLRMIGRFERAFLVH